MSAALRRIPSVAGRVGRMIGIVIVFVAAGAPIGGLAFILLVAATFGSLGKFDPGYELMESPVGGSLGLLLMSMAFGYGFGAGPAALAGLVIGIRQAFFGPTTWWMALGMGLLAGVVLVENLYHGFDPDLAAPDAILILTCVIAIMLCWSLVRNWHFAPIATEAGP